MKVIMAVLLTGVFLVVSGMDYQDAIEAEAWYINGFCKGYHPDYKNLSPNCEGQ